MLRLQTQRDELWDALLSPGVRLMSEELKTVDAILGDERFLGAFRTRFPSRRGRQTIPMETYLRLM